MEIRRVWAMPSKNTFEIKPVKELINKYLKEDILSVDAFANKNKLAKITNDLDPQYNTNYNLDALDFLKQLETNSVDLLFLDAPFSPRQVSECYKKLGRTVNMQTTQSSFWGNLKKEAGRIVKQGGVVINCGWTSGGCGKSNGFEIEEILLVPHGGNHNDTIITVDRKI